ncbi:MAG: hypothetical protein MZV65_47245 [Chromatiales bacterium]|nr:hypothetical protein [Chromatiales bacterium]
MIVGSRLVQIVDRAEDKPAAAAQFVRELKVGRCVDHHPTLALKGRGRLGTIHNRRLRLSCARRALTRGRAVYYTLGHHDDNVSGRAYFYFYAYATVNQPPLFRPGRPWTYVKDSEERRGTGPALFFYLEVWHA